jgi:hypothetical protein
MPVFAGRLFGFDHCVSGLADREALLVREQEARLAERDAMLTEPTPAHGCLDGREPASSTGSPPPSNEKSAEVRATPVSPARAH